MSAVSRPSRTRSVIFLVCLLAGCAGPFEEDESLEVQSEALQTVSAAYAGSTTIVSGAWNNAPNNNAAWLINQSDALSILNTRLTATVTHDGALTTAASGINHVAIGIRGCSMDAGLLEMNMPLQTGTFVWGEVVASTVSQKTLYDMTAGRGITFWPIGTTMCADLTRPCARFENYAEVQGVPQVLPGPVALSLTAAPFQVVLFADDWDTTVKVMQDGVTKANISCRTVSGNNPQCGAQPYNVAMADAFIAFVNDEVNPARTVGATSITVVHTKP
jgi:hypothetical protein